MSDGMMEDMESIVFRAYHALGCRDWARVDVRMDDAGFPNVCGVDPIPSLATVGDAIVVTAARAAGIGDDELVQRCLLIAAERVRVDMPSAPSFTRLPRRTPPGGMRIR